MTTLLTEAMVHCLGKVLGQQPSIALAYLYGSLARNQTTTFSDVDIALVLFQDKMQPLDRLRFELMIEDSLANDCQLGDANVHIINDAPLVVRGQVLTDGRLLFSRDEEFRVAFESYTRLAYFDFQPVEESIQATLFERVLRDGL